jgi:threonine/homoserine/homoserine lactone efflux protein
MAGDPMWRGVAAYALASGIAIAVMFVAAFALVIPPDAPLHEWGGLLQRVTIAVWFPCTIILALRLLRVARATDAHSD